MGAFWIWIVGLNPAPHHKQLLFQQNQGDHSEKMIACLPSQLADNALHGFFCAQMAVFIVFIFHIKSRRLFVSPNHPYLF